MQQKPLLLPYRSRASLKLLHIRQSASDLKYYASWFGYGDMNFAEMSSDTTDDDPPEGEQQNEEESNPDSEDSVAYSGMDSGPPSPISDAEDAAPGPDNDENASVAESGLWEAPKFRPELRDFAGWAFGPHGIPSLQVIALGDYAHGGRATWNNFFLCRCTEEGKRFRYLADYEPMAQEIRKEYRDTLEACPVEPLLGWE